MAYWITKINGFQHQIEKASGFIANRDATEAAAKVRFQVLNYFKYNGREESNDALGARLDGIMSGVQEGDCVVIQFPMWQNDPRFERRFFNKLAAKKNVKKILWVWDVLPWLHDASDRDFSKDYAFQVMNRCELIISPNRKMSQRLRDEGKVTVPIIDIGLWDYQISGELTEKKFEKKLFFVGTLDKTDFRSYEAETPFFLIGNPSILSDEVKEQQNLILMGEMKNNHIPQLFDGGFGVISYSQPKTDKLRFPGAEKYGHYNNPLKLSLYLGAGLPVIVDSNSAHAALVRDKNLGIVLDDLNSIDQILDELTEKEYKKILENVANYSSAIRSGFFTQKVLINALDFLNLGNTELLSKGFEESE